jgi:hypothetical protein
VSSFFSSAEGSHDTWPVLQKGLGHEVLWSVREDHLADVHFETRQYQFYSLADE